MPGRIPVSPSQHSFSPPAKNLAGRGGRPWRKSEKGVRHLLAASVKRCLTRFFTVRDGLRSPSRLSPRAVREQPLRDRVVEAVKENRQPQARRSIRFGRPYECHGQIGSGESGQVAEEPAGARAYGYGNDGW